MALSPNPFGASGRRLTISNGGATQARPKQLKTTFLRLPEDLDPSFPLCLAVGFHCPPGSFAEVREFLRARLAAGMTIFAPDAIELPQTS